MLLGKRARPPMKRTTSMTEFTLDLTLNDPSIAVFDPQNPFNVNVNVSPALSGRSHRRKSADFVETPHFLRACSLCKRTLIPGRDIFMYRGDSAFCSLECRQQQMNQDEKKEKCSLVASRKDIKNSAAAAATGGSDVSTTGETVAAM